MPFCTNCGGQVADSANFCTHCGKASGGAASTPAVSLSISKEARINQEWNALSPADWGSKKHADERALLAGLLEDSESLAGLVSGNFAFSGGFSRTNLGVATDRRLIFLRQTKRAPEVVSLPYDTIESCASSAGLMGGVVKGSAGAKGRFEMRDIYPKKQAESFADTVQSLITQLRERGLPAAEVAPPEMASPGSVELTEAAIAGTVSVVEHSLVPTGEPVGVMVSKESRLEADWNALAPADWGVKKHANERGMLIGLLDDSESLAGLVSGNFGPENSVSNDTYLVIATDRRLLSLRKGRRSDEITEIPYRDIAALDFNIGVLSGGITVSSQSEGRFRVQNIFPKDQAKAFASIVQPLIAAAQVGMSAVVGKEERIDQEWDALIPKGWGTFTDANMHSGERKMLYRLLESDEHLECLCGGDFKANSGESHIWRDSGRSFNSGVVVATDRRVIFLDKGIVSTEVAELTYKSIESISYSGGMMWGSLKFGLVGATTLPIENVKPKEQAKVFADTVRKHLNVGQTVAAPTVVQTASAMDELEKAAALYERGLLTREEFDAKKAQLLNS